MEHLTMEEIARLVDETPAAGEAEHLAACERCASALRAMEAQTHALAELPDPAMPPRLRGRVLAEVAGDPKRARRAPWSHPFARMAAAVAIFMLGGLAGSLTATPDPVAVGPAPTAPGSDPLTALATAESAYLAALGRYAEESGAPVGFDPVHRLATLESIVLTTGSALRDAPADPVINNYHLTALGQRDALLRALGAGVGEEEWF